MRIIYIFFFILLIAKNLLGSNIFETYEYELNFSSNNINFINPKNFEDELKYLSQPQENELLNWDAEIYRQSIR